MKKSLKKVCSVLLAGILLLPSLTTGTRAFADENKLPSGTPTAQIGQKIEDYVDQHRKTTAGMSTAVFDKDKTIYRGNFGYIDKEKKLSVTDDTVFEWGSITKLTVWISAMQLWEEGELDLERDVRDYLPKGTLSNLKYDKKITMLDLMNHQAGFQEKVTNTEVGENEKIPTLEEYVRSTPSQVYEPGKVAGYSNYGTVLAAYVVEQITGQSFKDYVHEHIFSPLGMTQSGIEYDLKDNAFARQGRMKVKGYDREGKLLGTVFERNADYPAGSIRGTLNDLQRFAQALLKQEPGVLFKRPETWKTLFTTTAYYGKTNLPSNAHGFWYVHRGVDVIGHGGNMKGFSANLQLDFASQTGMVVMVNQAQEQTYVEGIPNLVFGPYKKSAHYDMDKGRIPAGFYETSRTFKKGPLTLFANVSRMPLYLPKGGGEKVKDRFLVASREGDQVKLSGEYGDFLKISDSEVITRIVLLVLFALGLLYSLVSLLVNLGTAIYRKVDKKPALSTEERGYKVLQIIISLTAVAIPATYVGIIIAFSSVQTTLYTGLAILLAPLTLLILAASVKGVFTGYQGLTGWKVLSYRLSTLAGLAVTVNCLYWGLYQFWLL